MRPLRQRLGKKSARQAFDSPAFQEMQAITRAVRAALALAAKKPWSSVRIDDIRRKMGVSSASFPDASFPEPAALLPEIVRYIDERAQVADLALSDSLSPRERLFALLMARFDVLQTHRAGILSIAKACRRSPGSALRVFSALMASMQHILGLAALRANADVSPVEVWLLFGAYQYAFFSWESDRSSDMGKTMAALESALGRRERLGDFFRSCKSPETL